MCLFTFENFLSRVIYFSVKNCCYNLYVEFEYTTIRLVNIQYYYYYQFKVFFFIYVLVFYTATIMMKI